MHTQLTLAFEERGRFVEDGSDSQLNIIDAGILMIAGTHLPDLVLNAFRHRSGRDCKHYKLFSSNLLLCDDSPAACIAKWLEIVSVENKGHQGPIYQ